MPKVELAPIGRVPHSVAFMSNQPEKFRLEEVCVDFSGQRALGALNLEFAPGEAVALVGPSGAGKTTLLRLLNGSQRPSSGKVWFGDDELSRLSRSALRRLRASVAFVHQDLGLVPNLRAAQNVLAGGLGRQNLLCSLRDLLWPAQARIEQAYELLDRVGIGDKLYSKTDRLSGGEQQRVAIARALYQQPTALLADEPVASVDPARARDTLELLIELCVEHRLTLLVSLHSLELARAYFPRLIGLRQGRVAFDDAPKAIDSRQIDALFQFEGQGQRRDEPD
jgi:phosphonate transport system ATP-binding protein